MKVGFPNAPDNHRLTMSTDISAPLRLFEMLIGPLDGYRFQHVLSTARSPTAELYLLSAVYQRTLTLLTTHFAVYLCPLVTFHQSSGCFRSEQRFEPLRHVVRERVMLYIYNTVGLRMLFHRKYRTATHVEYPKSLKNSSDSYPIASTLYCGTITAFCTYHCCNHPATHPPCLFPHLCLLQ